MFYHNDEQTQFPQKWNWGGGEAGEEEQGLGCSRVRTQMLATFSKIQLHSQL